MDQSRSLELTPHEVADPSRLAEDAPISNIDPRLLGEAPLEDEQVGAEDE